MLERKDQGRERSPRRTARAKQEDSSKVPQPPKGPPPRSAYDADDDDDQARYRPSSRPGEPDPQVLNEVLQQAVQAAFARLSPGAYAASSSSSAAAAQPCFVLETPGGALATSAADAWSKAITAAVKLEQAARASARIARQAAQAFEDEAHVMAQQIATLQALGVMQRSV